LGPILQTANGVNLLEASIEAKKYCRVCGDRVPHLYKRAGGRRCVVCLHRTHREHLAGNLRVCRLCQEQELSLPQGYSQLPLGISLVHLTDLHLGGEEGRQRADLLEKWLAGRRQDYVLISGDLTRRAGGEEYRQAARWIDRVEKSGARLAVVPGNHDIGYWGNAMSVGRQALGRKYHRWINEIDRPLEPCLRGPGCVIVGLNSAHGIKPGRLFNGYLDQNQRSRAVELLGTTPPGHLKLIFCHHPLVRFANNTHRAMHGAEKVREELMAAGAGLFIWGHQHSFAAVSLSRGGKKCFAVQGPTLSDRIRDGHHPGLTVLDWLFGEKLRVRTFNIIDGSRIEEGPGVEFTLQEGTVNEVVE